MPTLEETKDELVKARKALDEQKTAFETAEKAHKSEREEERKKIDTLAVELRSKTDLVDDIMLKLAAPGVMPGNKGDTKGSETARKALDKWFRKQDAEMTVEEKALVIADGASSGVIIPAERSSRLIRKVVEVSPIRSLATVMRTNVDHLEIVKETGDLAASWTAEQGTLSEDTGTKFGLERVPVHAQNALVKVSRQMLGDAPLDLESYLFGKAGLKFGKSEGQAFLTGNGVGRPQGILATPNGTSLISIRQSTAGASGEFVPDDVLDTEADLISTYAANAVWITTRKVANFIRKFRDAHGQLLGMIKLDELAMLRNMNNLIAAGPGNDMANMQMAAGGGRAIMLDGYPLYEAVDMNELGAAAKVGVFGNIAEGYTIVDRENMIVIRDPYSSKATGLVDYLFERRVGGQVVQASAMVGLQCVA